MTEKKPKPESKFPDFTAPPTQFYRSNWTDYASCLDEDPELFQPIMREDPSIEEAKAICQGCKVRNKCAEFALDRREPSGIWGGITEWQRENLKTDGRKIMVAYLRDLKEGRQSA